MRIAQNPTLKANSKVLVEKMKIMALLELIFNLPKNARVLTFKQISEVTGVDLPTVELLVMRAMSLKLIKGAIDQVGQSESSTFLSPRLTTPYRSPGSAHKSWTMCALRKP